jgi:hypothetical protein
MTNIMRTLQEITNSLIESYNNNEKPNYFDIRDLEILSKKENNN